MIPVYLCEDEAAIRAFLEKEVRDAILIQGHDMQVVCSTADPKALLDSAHSHGPGGVYLLDIDLGIPGFTGFDLAKAIRRQDARGVLIFVTTHGELSMETFRYRLEAMDYILKDDMEQAGRRLRECLASVQERMLRQSADESSYYTVKVFDIIHNIPVGRILYFETSPQTHRIRLHADNEVVEFFGNLQTIETELGAGFFRCHRSVLANRDRIRAIHLKDNELEMVNGQRLPLSRQAKKTLANE